MKTKITLEDVVGRASVIFEKYLSTLPPDDRNSARRALHAAVECGVTELADSADVTAMLRERQGEQTLTQFASSLGCSASYISSVYSGTRSPGPKILNALGVVRGTKIRRWR